MALLWNASTLSLRYAPGRPPRRHYHRAPSVISGARVTTYAGTGRPPLPARPPGRRRALLPLSLPPSNPLFHVFPLVDFLMCQSPLRDPSDIHFIRSYRMRHAEVLYGDHHLRVKHVVR